jgi:hypothetical protein
MNVETIRPTPTDEEAAVIAAAIELTWPRPVVLLEGALRPPAWRFSGRWWVKPVAARRERPWY